MIPLEALRDCMDGEVPGSIATCGRDGVPNNSFVSQVVYVDDDHIALSFQFFNKTRANILQNPLALVALAHPISGARYDLHVRYVRTETEGALFESMKAKLSGIAQLSGMSQVFKLQGADVYRVLTIEAKPNQRSLQLPLKRSPLAAVRRIVRDLQASSELQELVEGVLDGLCKHLGVGHAMIHWLDETRERLYLIASRGYENSGAGSEIQLGQGVIGAAASARTSIRITHATAEYTYARAARDSIRSNKSVDHLEAAIATPGLPAPGSQLAAPILARGQLLGVLYLEDEKELRFAHDEEDAMVMLAQHIGALSQQTPPETVEQPVADRADNTQGAPIAVRHYAADDTIFVDDDYLIKGVAGAILWKLLRECRDSGRCEFTNRELRLDTSLRLPDISNNLEARLILLQKRLEERCPVLAIEKTGRGRFRLRQLRPVKLVDA